MSAFPSSPRRDLPATQEDLIDLTAFHSREGQDLYAKVDAFIEKMDGVRARGHYLWKSRMASPSDRRSLLGDEGAPAREMILLSSNNYLGLTTHPRVVAAHCDAAIRYGTGSGSAPFFSGTFVPHRALEEALAAHKRTEDACLFPSGYGANLGAITALARAGDSIFLDRLVHASIIDGARASGAALRLVQHNDPADLDRKLARYGRAGGSLVVVDAVYSMDGDVAPLPELLAVARRHGAVLLVDEAHSTGVLGARGRGIAEHFGIEADDLLIVGTLSKALASAGGFFAGPRKVVEYVRHYARSAMFSTALPPSAVAAAAAALDVIDAEPERVARLRANARHLRASLAAAGLSPGPGEGPIIPVVVGEEPRLIEMSHDLLDAGVHANCVFYPAVPRTECRLRLSVMATHTHADLDHAAAALAAAARRRGLLEAPRDAA